MSVFPLLAVCSIGRSGRFGRKGVAINFVRQEDIRILRDIEQYYATQIDEMPMNGTAASTLPPLAWAAGASVGSPLLRRYFACYGTCSGRPDLKMLDTILARTLHARLYKAHCRNRGATAALLVDVCPWKPKLNRRTRWLERFIIAKLTVQVFGCKVCRPPRIVDSRTGLWCRRRRRCLFGFGLLRFWLFEALQPVGGLWRIVPVCHLPMADADSDVRGYVRPGEHQFP